jgi:hypothetical protein
VGITVGVAVSVAGGLEVGVGVSVSGCKICVNGTPQAMLMPINNKPVNILRYGIFRILELLGDLLDLY